MDMLFRGSRSHPEASGIFLFRLVSFKAMPLLLHPFRTLVSALQLEEIQERYTNTGRALPSNDPAAVPETRNAKPDNLLGRVGDRKMQGESQNYSPNKLSSHRTKFTSMCYVAFYRPCLYFPIYKMG